MKCIHLDFHTSPTIDGIGENFSAEEFTKTIKEARVELVTVFAKCHHGYSYHPTKANTIHPGLKFDLLGEQLAVCKELGVNAPVYISAGFDEKEYIKRPEWRWLPFPQKERNEEFLNKRKRILVQTN